jgi:hypothetical protein
VHMHADSWCSTRVAEPFIDRPLWHERLPGTTDELYGSFGTRGFVEQSLLVDAALIQMWMAHAEACRMHVRRAPIRASDCEPPPPEEFSRVPWKALQVMNYLRVFGLIYTPHVRSIEHEIKL